MGNGIELNPKFTVQSNPHDRLRRRQRRLVSTCLFRFVCFVWVWVVFVLFLFVGSGIGVHGIGVGA